MNSKDITVTDGRLHNVLDLKINQVVDNRNIPKLVDDKIQKSKIHTGGVIKFYPYLDKVLVRMDTNKQDVLCKILHRMDGAIIDFFTPEGELVYCEKLKEPCIMPRARMNVCILDINDNTEEQLLLGFYHKDDVVYVNPAEQGHYKIVNVGATNQLGLDIGMGEVNIKSMEGVNFTEGVYSSKEEQVEYANKQDTPNIDDVYTKEEVDEAIRKAIEDLKTELGIEGD